MAAEPEGGNRGGLPPSSGEHGEAASKEAAGGVPAADDKARQRAGMPQTSLRAPGATHAGPWRGNDGGTFTAAGELVGAALAARARPGLAWPGRAPAF